MDELYRLPHLRRHLIFLVALVVLSLSGHWTAAAESLPIFRRSLAVELGEIEGASLYEIELRKLSASGLNKPVFFRFKKPIWKAELTPGSYQVRLRSYDDRDVAGEWSEMFPLDVPLPAPKIDQPEESAVFEASGPTHDVEVAWAPVREAESYRVEVLSGSVTVTSHQIQENQVKLSLPAGATYNLIVTAIGLSAKAGDSTAPVSISVLGAPLEGVEFKAPTRDLPSGKLWFRWNADPKATDFIVAQAATVAGISIAQANFSISPSPDGIYELWVTPVARYYRSSDARPQFVQVRGGKVVAYGKSRADLTNTQRPHSPRAIWFGLGALGANFRGQNSDFASDLSFNDAEGFGAKLSAQVPQVWQDFDFNMYLAAAQFGVIDSSSSAVDSFSISAETSLGRMFRLFGSDYFCWGYEIGAFYTDVPEYLGSVATGAVGLQYFQALGAMVGGYVQYRPNRNWVASVSLNVELPLGWVQAPAKPTKSSIDHVNLRIDRRLKESLWLGAGFENALSEFSYPNAIGGENQFRLEINQLNLKMGYEF